VCKVKWRCIYGSRSWPVILSYKSFENAEILKYSQSEGIGNYINNADNQPTNKERKKETNKPINKLINK
jgi:hypothetical protein